MRGRRPPGRTLPLSLTLTLALGAAVAGALGPIPNGPVASAAPPADPVSSYVVRSVPGFSVASSGPLSAHRFASYDPDPAAVTAALGQLTVGGGFNAYLRTWSTTAGTALGDVVITFASPARATAYVSAARASLPAGPTLGPATVPGVGGVTGVTYPSPYSPAATERVALFTVARTAVIVGATEPGNSTDLVAGPMATLAIEQDRLLTASPYGTEPGRWWDNRLIGWEAVVLGVLALGLTVTLVRFSRRDGGTGATSNPVGAVPVDGTTPGVAPEAPGLGGGRAPPAGPAPSPWPSVPPAGTAPGWLRDPGGGDGRIRYWDGTAWTVHTALPR